MNSRTTEAWRRRHVLRCAALLPEDGVPEGLFFEILDEDCQATARELLRRGILPSRDGRIAAPSVRLDDMGKPVEMTGVMDRVTELLEDGNDVSFVRENRPPPERMTAAAIRSEMLELIIRGNSLSEHLMPWDREILRQARRYCRESDAAGESSEESAAALRCLRDAMDEAEKRMCDELIRDHYQERGRHLCAILENLCRRFEWGADRAGRTYRLLGHYYLATGQNWQAIGALCRCRLLTDEFDPRGLDDQIGLYLALARYLGDEYICVSEYEELITVLTAHFEKEEGEQ